MLTEDNITHDPSAYPARKDVRVLVIGCGNSRLSEEMKEDGFESVTSVDFSNVVIQQMSTKHPKSTYEVMDITKPYNFADGSFDLIICKATLDAVLCGAGSIKNANTMLTECSRILSTTGALVVVSYGTPENRMVHFESNKFGWSVDTHTVPKPQLGISQGENPG